MTEGTVHATERTCHPARLPIAGRAVKLIDFDTCQESLGPAVATLGPLGVDV